MQLKDVVGQEPIKNKLVELIQQNRLSHALLFLGKEGVGALPLALAFAQYIVCEKAGGYQQKDTGASLFGEAMPEPILLSDSCGTCPACVKSALFTHPDIHFSFPVITSKPGQKPVSADFIVEWREFLLKTPYANSYDWLQQIGAENKQGNITAEECNRIIHDMSLKSFESEYKVLIMWMPEYLSKEGNKLLKLIEEPPANTLFILVAENEEKILPTILSRCQLVKIPAIETAAIEKALVEKEHIAPDAAKIDAAMSEGNYRIALQLAHDGTGSEWEAYLREWLNAIFVGGPIVQVKWVEDISKIGRERQKQFLQYFNHILAESLRLQLLVDTDYVTSGDKAFSERINTLIQPQQQQAIIQELDKAAYYIERNANPKMLFHALSIQLIHIIKENALILTH